MELALRRLVCAMAAGLLLMSACDGGERSSSATAGQRVAPSPDLGMGSRTPCTIPTERAEAPVTEDYAERLAAQSLGVDTLEDAAATRQAATVCRQSLKVWRVSGGLPNGDDVVSLIDGAKWKSREDEYFRRQRLIR